MSNTQFERIENIVRALMNKNSVIYSNHSKTSDTLSNGICTLQINSIDKSFVFTYGRNHVVISPLDNSIKNLELINIMKNQYIRDAFAAINNVLDLYKQYVRIDGDSVTIDKLLINTVNGFTTDDFALTSHNHDDKYSPLDHTHEEYALTTHTHEVFNNDLTINGGLTIKGYQSAGISLAYPLQLLNDVKDNRISIGSDISDNNNLIIRFYNSGKNSSSNFGEIVMHGQSQGIKLFADGSVNIQGKTTFKNDLITNGNVTCSTINGKSTNDFAPLNHVHDQYLQTVDLDDIKQKLTGISYNKELIGIDEEEEEIYEEYTTINQELRVNGTINGITTTDIALIEEGILSVADVIAFEDGITLSTVDSAEEEEAQNSLLITFPNGNSIMLDDTGHAYGIINNNGELTSEYYLTKQMIIDDEEIQEILTGAPGEDGEGYKKSWLEWLLDGFSFAMSLAEFAELASKIYTAIKAAPWANVLLSRIKNVFRGARGYIPIVSRSVVFDENDISTDEDLSNLEGPDEVDLDQEFNESNYLLTLFPEMNVIFKNLIYYYKDVDKGKRTNELGMLLVDCQIYRRFLNHTHDEYSGISYTKNLISVDEEEEYTTIDHELRVSGNIKCSTINGKNTNDFALTTHNHDGVYAAINHEHEEYLQAVDLDDIKHKITGVSYAVELIPGEEETYYTTIDQELRVNGNVECDTINDIYTSDIALTSHNHDDVYAAINHTHDEYSLTNHSHDDKYSPINHEHEEYSLMTHSHDDKYSPIDHTHDQFNTLKINGNLQTNTLNGYPRSGTKLVVPSIPVIQSGVFEIANSLDFHNSSNLTGTDFHFRISLKSSDPNLVQFFFDDVYDAPSFTFNKAGNFTCSTINGKSTNDFASSAHNHDDVYAAINHEHDQYALTTHNHDDKYASLNHTHSNYSLTDHNHDDVYAAINHEHDQYSLTTHNHDDKYASLNHTHVFEYLNFQSSVINDVIQNLMIEQAENKLIFSVSYILGMLPADIKELYIDYNAESPCNHIMI